MSNKLWSPASDAHVMGEIRKSMKLEKANKPYGHVAYTRKTKSGKIVQVGAKGVKQKRMVPYQSPPKDAPYYTTPREDLDYYQDAARRLRAIAADPRQARYVRNPSHGAGIATKKVRKIQATANAAYSVMDAIRNLAEKGKKTHDKREHTKKVKAVRALFGDYKRGGAVQRLAGRTK